MMALFLMAYALCVSAGPKGCLAFSELVVDAADLFGIDLQVIRKGAITTCNMIYIRIPIPPSSLCVQP